MMGKATVEFKKNKYDVVNKLVNPEAINERELNAIAGGLMDSLIPVTTEMNKKGVVLKSSIIDRMSLRTYFNSVVSKKMFFDVILQMIAVVKECERNSLNVSNLMLDRDYIFLDPRTKHVKCIFWPIVNNQNPRGIAEFFHELPFHVVFSKHEDHGYMRTYLQYFRKLTPFSINSFEKLILEITGKTVDTKFHIPTGSAEMRGENSSSKEFKTNTGNISYNPFQNQGNTNDPKSKVCSTCKKVSEEWARYCSNCGTPLNIVDPLPGEVLDISQVLGLSETQSFSETTVLGAAEVGGTTVLGADVLDELAFPYLIREKTEEKISVNKPSFRIGKENSYCDYFVSDNNAISRSHADIITRDQRYYIIDHNSTNKTYVDGRVIPVKKEIEIFSGTKIRLANEDFVFYI